MGRELEETDRELEDMDTVEFLKNTRAVDYKNGKYNIECVINTKIKTTWTNLINNINFLSENVPFVQRKNKNRHELIRPVIQKYNEIYYLVNCTYSEIVGSDVNRLLENEYELSVLENYLKTAYKQILSRLPINEKEHYKKWIY